MLLIAWFVKSEKMKNTRGDAYVSPGLLRHSKTPLELNHTADDIPGFHEVECFLNIIQANLLRDHRIQIKSPLQVILRKQREIVAWQRIPAVANL